MINQTFRYLIIIPAAFVFLSAAVFGVAQEPANIKQNARPATATPTPAPVPPAELEVSSTKFTYEFTQPEFFVRHIFIEHDAGGHGRITFERLHQDAAIVEPVELSATALARISSLWRSLNFLDSTQDYQAERQFPHLGTMRLGMEDAGRKRIAEFNWTKNDGALALTTEYRRVADQAILVFDISVARETQPLNGPKLMEELELQLKRNGLSDPKQMLPILRDITSDEHLPLIARNHAARLIKKLDK